MSPLAWAEGRGGEEAACRFLRRQGYRILERNYHGPRFEVDIIAREGDVLVFVEVKTRVSGRTDEGAHAVGPRKQWRITRAAEHYLLKNPQARDRPCRFDVVLMEVPSGGKPRAERLLRDAFR